MGRPAGLHTKALTAQQRHDVKLLFFQGGLSKPEISRRLNISVNQVRYALRHGDEPQFHVRGVKPKLTEEQTNRLLVYISSSPVNRLLSYAELSKRSAEITGASVGPDCIRSTLRRHGWLDPNRSSTPSALRKKRHPANVQKYVQQLTTSTGCAGDQPTEDSSLIGNAMPQPAHETPLLVPEPNLGSPHVGAEDTVQSIDDYTSFADDDDDGNESDKGVLETCDQLGS